MKFKLSGHLAALMACVVWGLSCSVFIRSIHLPGPIITQGGMLIGAIATGLYVWFKRRDELSLAWREHKRKLLLIAVATVGCSVTLQWASKTTTIANATLTHAFQPMLTCLIFAPLFLKQKLDRSAVRAAVIGLAGLVILLWPELNWDGPKFGIVMGLISAVFFAWANAQTTKFNGTLSRETVLFVWLALGSIMLLPFTLIRGLPAHVEPGTGLKLLVFGLVNYVLGYGLFYLALSKEKISRVAIYTYLEQVVGIGAAALFLNEPLTSNALLGGVLIICSGALVMYGPTHHKCSAHRH
jgi:drug/metabolite transporter (DMT)-like permease